MRSSVLLISSLFLVSCGATEPASPEASTSKPPPVTENDFEADPAIRATPESTAVTFLEPATDTAQFGDTIKGLDVIPYRYATSGPRTLCWEDSDVGAAHFLLLKDGSGVELARVQTNACQTLDLPAGDYAMELHHDGKTYPFTVGGSSPPDAPHFRRHG
jgi:hypothetical protein